MEAAKHMGIPLKIDNTTAMAFKARFARICVEVDLRKPLVSKVCVGYDVLRVEYEGLHTVCFHCGVVGHRAEFCPVRPSGGGGTEPGGREKPQNSENLALVPMQTAVTTGPIPSPTASGSSGIDREFGPWILAKQRFRRNGPGNKGQNWSNLGRGNRFAALNMEEMEVVKEGKDFSEDQSPSVDPSGMLNKSGEGESHVGVSMENAKKVDHAKLDSKGEKKRGKGIMKEKEGGVTSDIGAAGPVHINSSSKTTSFNGVTTPLAPKPSRPITFPKTQPTPNLVKNPNPQFVYRLAPPRPSKDSYTGIVTVPPPSMTSPDTMKASPPNLPTVPPDKDEIMDTDDTANSSDMVVDSLAQQDNSFPPINQ